MASPAVGTIDWSAERGDVIATVGGATIVSREQVAPLSTPKLTLVFGYSDNPNPAEAVSTGWRWRDLEVEAWGSP